MRGFRRRRPLSAAARRQGDRRAQRERARGGSGRAQAACGERRIRSRPRRGRVFAHRQVVGEERRRARRVLPRSRRRAGRAYLPHRERAEQAGDRRRPRRPGRRRRERTLPRPRKHRRERARRRFVVEQRRQPVSLPPGVRQRSRAERPPHRRRLHAGVDQFVRDRPPRGRRRGARLFPGQRAGGQRTHRRRRPVPPRPHRRRRAVRRGGPRRRRFRLHVHRPARLNEGGRDTTGRRQAGLPQAGRACGVPLDGARHLPPRRTDAAPRARAQRRLRGDAADAGGSAPLQSLRQTARAQDVHDRLARIVRHRRLLRRR